MKSRQKIKSHKVEGELLSEQSPELLKELHLLTSTGELNADARRKLKQVNHLVNLIRPALDDLITRHPQINVVDVGAGKSYLGFILYELFFKNAETSRGKIYSVESRDELVKKSRATAEKLGFSGMEFILEKMENAQSGFLPPRVHLLTALHACDTATDDALITGIRAGADYLALVPCCQAEVAGLLKSSRGGLDLPGEINELWAHGLHRREFGSHLTNVIRALVLESFGYQVTVTELVGWEHSLKNEFILAKKINRENKTAKERLVKFLSLVQVRPKAVRVLIDASSTPAI